MRAVKRAASYAVPGLLAWPIFYLAVIGAFALARGIDHEHRREIVTAATRAR